MTAQTPECEEYETVIAGAEGPIEALEHCGKTSFPSHVLHRPRSEIKRRLFSSSALIYIQL